MKSDLGINGPYINICQMVKRACLNNENSVAIEIGDHQIKYGDLLQMVTDVRDELDVVLKDGHGVVEVVGHRSTEVVIATLAVWFSGRTLMLIEDTLPKDRQKRMRQLVPSVGTIQCGKVGEITVSQTDPVSNIFQNLDGKLAQDDCAYVAFTSGSTGSPKAILGSKVGLSHFLDWQVSEFGINADDRFAHLTNLTFDVWLRDVFTPLIAGGTLCIPEQLQIGTSELLDFLSKRKITALHSVPSVASSWLMNANLGESIESLRLAFFAGEPLDANLIKRWKKIFPKCCVVNLYGPSETTLAKHFKRIPSNVRSGVQSIGMPIPGSKTFILNEKLEPCEVNKKGEICISTEYRSFGYLADNGLYSPFVKFEHPDGNVYWIYRSGDIGFCNDAGEIEICGRQDDQVKINGVRIELNEIKSVICEQNGVRQAFVCAITEGNGKVIAAVIEASPKILDDVKIVLKCTLPSVMVPSRVLIVPAMPRLANGKLDRVKLTDSLKIHSCEKRLVQGLIVPDTSRDRISQIWQQVLQCRTLFSYQNFFDVGGTSLSIVDLHSRIEEEFKVRFPMVKLFEYSDVRGQATLIDQLLVGMVDRADPRPKRPALQSMRRHRIITARRGRPV
jgi:amino acid adenylation domain-containing protein